MKKGYGQIIDQGRVMCEILDSHYMLATHGEGYKSTQDSHIVSYGLYRLLMTIKFCGGCDNIV